MMKKAQSGTKVVKKTTVSQKKITPQAKAIGRGMIKNPGEQGKAPFEKGETAGRLKYVKPNPKTSAKSGGSMKKCRGGCM